MISFLLYNDVEENLAIESIKTGFPKGSFEIIISETEEEKFSFYKRAVGLAKGDFVAFVEASATYRVRSVQGMLEQMEKHKSRLFCVTPVYFNPKEAEVLCADFPETSKKINLEKDYQMFNLCLGSYFIPVKHAKKLFLEEGYTEEHYLRGLIALLEKKKSLSYISECDYVFATAPENDSYNYSEQYKKEWYIPTLKEEILPFVKDHRSRFAQMVVYYWVQLRYFCNWNDRCKDLLEEEEVEELHQTVYEILQWIEDGLLVEFRGQNTRLVPFHFYVKCLKWKYKNDESLNEVCCTKKFLTSMYNGQIYLNKGNLRARVKDINWLEEGLQVEGVITNVWGMTDENFSVICDANGKKYPVTRSENYSLTKAFGQTIHRDYIFSVIIPREDFVGAKEDRVNVEFYVERNGYQYHCKLFFDGAQARISKQLMFSYWRFDKTYLLTYSKQMDKMVIFTKKSDFDVLKRERHLEKEIKQWSSEVPEASEFIKLRRQYYLKKKKYADKKVWVIYDQLFKGGDNGEYLFRYLMENPIREDIDPYYVITDTSLEYPELKQKYGDHILEFDTPRCRLMSLFADIIFATRVNVKLFCGFKKENEMLIRDLFDGKVVCLQHGLTVQKIAQWQNRMFDNTRLYYLASPYEIENLKHPIYGYDEETLLLTGAPRYDGLHNRAKKQILITPTWRRNVTAGTNTKGKENEYSVNFKNTKYFEIYNSLINNEKLISCAKKTGYQIKFLIHPILSPQIGDYDQNEFVEILTGSTVNYDDILSESALMVTDFSGIQFDFAYMKKPVLYYHPKELPAQYDAKALNYEEMGFGPVCETEEAIVDQICEYMNRNCDLPKMYEERINDFFPMIDHDNSKRVYEATLKYFY